MWFPRRLKWGTPLSRGNDSRAGPRSKDREMLAEKEEGCFKQREDPGQRYGGGEAVPRRDQWEFLHRKAGELTGQNRRLRDASQKHLAPS